MSSVRSNANFLPLNGFRFDASPDRVFRLNAVPFGTDDLYLREPAPWFVRPVN